MDGNILHTSSETFEQDVLKSKLPIFVDFYADWCGPCKVVSPLLDILSTEYKGKLNFVKVDVDASPDIAGKYGIQSIPTMMIFKDGKPVARMVGAAGKDYYERQIKSIVE